MNHTNNLINSSFIASLNTLSTQPNQTQIRNLIIKSHTQIEQYIALYNSALYQYKNRKIAKSIRLFQQLLEFNLNIRFRCRVQAQLANIYIEIGNISKALKILNLTIINCPSSYKNSLISKIQQVNLKTLNQRRAKSNNKLLQKRLIKTSYGSNKPLWDNNKRIKKAKSNIYKNQKKVIVSFSDKQTKQSQQIQGINKKSQHKLSWRSTILSKKASFKQWRPQYVIQIASILNDMGQDQKAQRAIKSAIKSCSKDVLYQQLGDYQQRKENIQAAIHNYDKCLSVCQKQQNKIRVIIKKAKMLLCIGQKKSIQSAYQILSSLIQKQPQIRILAAKALDLLNKPIQALKIFQNCQSPLTSQQHYYYAMFLIKNGKLMSAIPHLHEGLQGAQCQKAAFQITKLALVTPQKNNAQKLLEDIAQNQKIEVDIKLGLSRLALLNFDQDHAKQILFSGKSKSFIQSLQRGKIHMQLHEYKKAIHEFKKVLIQQPQHAYSWKKLGMSCYLCGQDKRLSTAIQALKYSQQLGLQDQQLKECLGQCLFRIGRYKQAQQILSNLAKTQQNIEILSAGNYFKGNYLKALQLQQKLPQTSRTSYFKGCCYIQLRNFKQAIYYFKDSIDKDPDLSSAYYNLGLCYFIQRESECAQEYLEQAIKLNPRHIPWKITLFDIQRDKQNIQRQLRVEIAKHRMNSLPLRQYIVRYYYKKGRTQQSTKQLQKIKVLDPFRASSIAQELQLFQQSINHQQNQQI